MLGACSEAGDQVGLDVEYVAGGEGADVLGYVFSGQEEFAAVDGAAGQVLDQFAAYRRRGDDAGAGDDSLDLAPDVGGVPGRPPGTEPGQHEVGDCVAVDATDRGPRPVAFLNGGVGRGEPEVPELVAPPLGQLSAVGGDDLVGSRRGPGAAVPCAA